MTKSTQQTDKQESSAHDQRPDREQAESTLAPAALLQRAMADPGTLTPNNVKSLQRTIGNRAVARLLRPQVQRKSLTLGAANDGYEQEADRVAAQVVRQFDAAPPTPVQRQDEEEEEIQASRTAQSIRPLQRQAVIKRTFQKLQRSPAGQPTHGPEGGEVDAGVQQQIQRARGGGRPLGDDVRSRMEGGFGADFSGVRVHTGGQADQLNRSLNARAFTVGNDVFFRSGEYNPGSGSGQQLLAHELTHTIQQGASGVQPQRVQRLLITSNQLKATAGAPSEDAFFGAKKMSVKYKDVLAKLDAYHLYLSTTRVNGALPAEQKREVYEILDDIVRVCDVYLKAHPDEERTPYIRDLLNNATLEKRNVNRVAASAVANDGQLWRDVIEGHEFGETGALAKPMGATEITREPGLEALFKRQTSIYESDTLTGKVAGTAKKNDKAMRTNVPNRTDIVYVEHYTENGKSMAVQARGFVRERDVSKSEYSHEKLTDGEPIFTGPPSMDDVQQRYIGDCYLQAAIASVVKTNPLFVYNMIKDNGNGTVTVRLYNIAIDPPEATYINLNKSLVSGNRRSMGAPWVAFIEKAVASMGIGTGGRQVSTSYGELGSGNPTGYAFALLTGKPVGGGGASEQGGHAGTQPFWNQGTRLNYKMKYKVRKEKGTLSANEISLFKNTMAYKLFDNEAKAEALMDWAIDAGNSALVTRFESAAKVGRIEEFEPVLVDFLLVGGLSKEIKEAVETDIRATFAGIVGSGIYTPRQIRTFAAIKDALDTGKAVGAGTSDSSKVRKSNVTKGTGGGYAGESKGKGIVSGHAYSVLGYRESGNLKYLTLRNPWGHYGSEYTGVDPITGELIVEGDEDKLQANEKPFELELTDFTDNYKEYSIATL